MRSKHHYIKSSTRRSIAKKAVIGGSVVGLSKIWTSPIVNAVVLPVHAQSSGSINCNVNQPYGPGNYQFQVPLGVKKLNVIIEGASGGRGGNSNAGAGQVGGPGARGMATLTVSPGQTLDIVVGRMGGDGGLGNTGIPPAGLNCTGPGNTNCTSSGGGPFGAGPAGLGGSGGGGNGGQGEGGGTNGGGGGGGGGASSISINGNYCLVSGGGGGAGGGPANGGLGASTGAPQGINGSSNGGTSGGVAGTSGANGGLGGNSGDNFSTSGDSGSIGAGGNGGNGWALSAAGVASGWMVGDTYDHSPLASRPFRSGGGGGGGAGGGGTAGTGLDPAGCGGGRRGSEFL